MRPASLSTGWTQLNNAMKNLRLQWEETKMHWHDPVRQAFEDDLWKQLEPRVRAVLLGMDRLGQVLGQAQKDCE